MLKLWQRFREMGFWGFTRYMREELDNQKQNRELVGTDRNGNKYYQYYSYYGLPTRREIRFSDPNNFDMDDLVYYRWLYKFDLDPLTTEQKEQLSYLEERLRKQRALEWDRKDRQLVEQFRRKRQELLLRNQALKQLEEERKNEKLTDIKTRRQ